MLKTVLLYPSDYFDINKVESLYQEEYDACRKFTEFIPILYNHDILVSEHKLILNHNGLGGLGIIRGWMLKPEQYAFLYKELNERGIRLVNQPEEYDKCHLFPYIYEEIRSFTARTLWFESIEDIKWNEINETFPRFMIKDYVKSLKNTEFPQYFQTPANESEMKPYLERFVEMRGELYTGGIVLKEYVDLKKYGSKTNEYRVFYLKGEPAAVSRNSNQSKDCPVVPASFVQKFTKIKSNFYTVDFAEAADGSWLVLETGDGQVSGLSPGQHSFKFYDEIRRILKDPS